MLLQVLDHRPMGRQSKSLVHNMLSERDIHRVAFRLRNEFAGNIAQPACRASERDICQRLIDLNASIHQREGHDVLARPRISMEMIQVAGWTTISILRVQDGW